MARSTKYPAELRARAVRMVQDHAQEYPSQLGGHRPGRGEDRGEPGDPAQCGCGALRSTAASGQGSPPTSESGCGSWSARTASFGAPTILKAAATLFGAELDGR